MSPEWVQSNSCADCTQCTTSILSHNTIRTLSPTLLCLHLLPHSGAGARGGLIDLVM